MTDDTQSREREAEPTPRAAPQYGQYASAEEQRERMGGRAGPGLDASPQPVSHVTIAPPSEPADAPGSTPAARPRRMLVDRIITAGLLAYGLMSVFQSFSIFTDPTALLTRMGMGTSLSDPQSAVSWGVAACVVLMLGWVVTAGLTWVWARRGRLAFWIPIAGGVLFTTIAAVLVVIPLVNDPAVIDAVLGGG